MQANAGLWLCAALTILLPPSVARADASADLGGAQFSQRVVAEMVLHRWGCPRPEKGKGGWNGAAAPYSPLGAMGPEPRQDKRGG